jgi:hypothetical protein
MVPEVLVPCGTVYAWVIFPQSLFHYELQSYKGPLHADHHWSALPFQCEAAEMFSSTYSCLTTLRSYISLDRVSVSVIEFNINF